MYLYFFVDTMVTLSESFGLYVLMRCFCKKNRLPAAISRILPPLSCFVLTFLLTWFTDIGAMKMVVVFLLGFLLIGLCYEISVHENLMIQELYWLLTIVLPESLVTALSSLVLKGDVMCMVNGEMVIKWQIYIFNFVVRMVLLAVIYLLLRSFRYHINPGDVAVLSVGFFMAFAVSFISTYGYLNLGMADTLFLDLASSILCVSFIIQFLYSKNVSYLREQERLEKMQILQLQQQFSYYQEKRRDEERVRSVYHDMKNHLLVLERQAGSPETAGMVERLLQEVARYEDYIHTGNDILDIILKEKAERARQKQIAFSAAADLEGMDFIEPLDISTIFGNGLDNALEACEKLPEGQGAILVKAGRIQDFFSVLIENNCLVIENDRPKRSSFHARPRRRHTEKEDDFLHGFGIPNMEKAAEKYGGQLTAGRKKDKFTLKILIPIPK